MLKAYAKSLAYINSLRSDEEGATAVEYGLIVALIAAVIIGVVVLLGGEIQAAFQKIVDGIPGGATTP